MDVLTRQNAVELIEEKPEHATNQIDSGCETSTTKSIEETLTTTTVITSDTTQSTTDLLILRRDPGTNRKIINKTAYAKLHRSLSPTRQLDSIKARYETSENECDPTKSDNDTPKLRRSKSKLPVAKSRSSVKSEIILSARKIDDESNYRSSLKLDNKSKKKDENSNEIFKHSSISSSSSGEFLTIVRRSESIETVDKFERELNLFTMEKKPKEKKRANSFRKIFTGKIFGKDKKKKGEHDDTDSAQQKKNVNSDNIENEYNASSRQTTTPIKRQIVEERRMPPSKVDIREIEKKYAQMRVKEFENIKQNFENPESPIDRDKPMPMPMPMPTVNAGPMDFKKVANINKFIDTSSSSASNAESDKDNNFNNYNADTENAYKSLRFVDNSRSTPPRAQELRQIQGVRLVNPKALIPINSERPLPNPYQNIASAKPKISPKPQMNRLESNYNSSPKTKGYTQFDFIEPESSKSPPRPIFEETYGTVFDNIETIKKEAPIQNTGATKIIEKPPKSPSLEATKLRLPLNRDLGPMSPRMRSPIPQHHVSAEKLIATELLRSSRSPTPTKKKANQFSPSHQKLEIGIDYPDNVNIVNRVVTSKPPPISRIPEYVVRNNQMSPNYENRGQLAKTFDSQEILSPSRPAEFVSIQSTDKLSPEYERRQQLTTFIGSDEILSEQLTERTQQRISQPLSPNHENRRQLLLNGSREKLTSPRMFEQTRVAHKNGQILPNYENRNQLIGSQERLSNARTPDHILIQRNSRLSPVYDNRNRINSSQEKLLNSTFMRSPTPSSLAQNPELSAIRPQSSRSSTPVDLRIPQSSSNQSPQKEEIRKSVEAYYWKEIKKLKEQENRDMYYYQMQLIPFGYAEDPISFRRSRSSSPSQRNGRRSLSLPRESKSQIPIVEVDGYGRFQPASIPEGRAVINYSNHYPENFRRNAPERRTIDAVPRHDGNSIYRPIFKRGSLTTPVREYVEEQQYKKVSFGKAQNTDVWPTKNGYTQSPPQRKIEGKRHESIDDDVFLPNPQQTSKLIVDGKEIYGYTNRPFDNPNMRQQEPPYYQNANFYREIHQEPIYDSRVVFVRENMQEEPTLSRYNSVQFTDPTLRQQQQQRFSRRMSFDNSQTYIPKPQIQQKRRQIIVKDDIHGYFGEYVPNDQHRVIYASKQNIAEPVYGYSRGIPRQVTIQDKVCDIYGQIHDSSSPSLNVRKSGVIIGQLQSNQNSSHSQLPNQNFVRNSRLTASANDMYKQRYQNVDPRYPNNTTIYDRYPTPRADGPPSRPLPPVPTEKKHYPPPNRDDTVGVSDVRKTSSVERNKKRGIFGNNVTEEKQLYTFDLSRLILLEQLHLIRRQKELEMNKRNWQLPQNKEERFQKLQLEFRGTENLCISDLKKLVLTEELELIKLKMGLEHSNMKYK